MSRSRSTAATATGHRFAMDLRHFERPEWVALLELTLSALDADDTLEVVFPSWPELLIRHLERHYAGQLAWWAGDEHEEWCSLVIRRECAPDAQTMHHM